MPFKASYVGRWYEHFSPPTRVSGSVNMANRPHTRNSIVFFGVLCILKLHFFRALTVKPKIAAVVLLVQTKNSCSFLGLVHAPHLSQSFQYAREDVYGKPLCPLEQ